MKKALLLLVSALPLVAAAPMLEKITMWQEGDDGYRMFRIPGLAVTQRGTVLAYAEARRVNGNDWTTINIVLRRSTDGGRTFSPHKIVAHVEGEIQRNPVAVERKQAKPGDITYNNAVAIPTRDGAVHFLFCLEYQRAFYMRSDDDGVTFSKPVEITSTFDALKKVYRHRVIAIGPGHGIELRKGRLLATVWMSPGTGGNGHYPSAMSTIYSDDKGKTWHAGDIAIPDTPETPSPNEAMPVELADGRVMLNVRAPAERNRRLVVVSKDGAHHWSKARYQEDLPDPVCFASILRLSTKKTGGRTRILFANPDNLLRKDNRKTASKDRMNLTIRVSYDEGASWTVKRLLEDGSSGYSDLALLPDGTILCMYEIGNAPGAFPDRKMILARFNLEWVTEGKDSLAKKGKK